MPNEGLKILNLMKQAAIDAVMDLGPCNVVLGIVTSISPLSIKLEDGFEVPAKNIILTKGTSLWSVDMDVDHNTEAAEGGSGEARYASHKHGYKGRKTYLVHNELAVGDEVILVRAIGGQIYVALDKKYNPDRGCSD